MMEVMQNNPERWYIRLTRNIRQKLRWFAPGLGVKRWLTLILVGTTLIGVGIAMPDNVYRFFHLLLLRTGFFE